MMKRMHLRLAFTAAIFSIGLLASASHAGTVVRLTTNYTPAGSTINYFDVELYDDDASITVANFLQYVNDGRYDGTIIHRSVEDFITQGGGFAPTIEDGNITALDAIASYGTIVNEYSADRSNIYGTIAMAKVADDPDSATNQWFINVADNSENLDNQNGGFTVFGEVIGDGMTLVNAINGLTSYDLSSYFGSTFSEVPLFNDGSEFVTITSAAVISSPDTDPEPEPICTYTGKISGVAYVDSNQNGLIDGDDCIIANAKVTITAEGSSTPLATVITGSDGSYSFSNLGFGPYSVKIETTCGLTGQDAGTGHTILDADGMIVSLGGSVTAEQNGYGAVGLGDGQQIINLNISQAAYPAQLLSARQLLNSNLGPDYASAPAKLHVNTTGDSVLDIGCVLVGDTGSATMTVSNLGGVRSTLKGLLPEATDLFGGGASSFGPLGVGQSASQEYTFSPTERGAESQEFIVTSSVGNVTAKLTGIGVAPISSVSQTEGFYALVGHTTTAIVEVTNEGNGNLSGVGERSNLLGKLSAGTGIITGDGDDALSLQDEESKECPYYYVAGTIGEVVSGTITADFENGSTDGTNQEHTREILVGGTGVAPIADLTSTAADVPEYALVGKTYTLEVTVKNEGNGNLSGLGDISNLNGALSDGAGILSGTEEDDDYSLSLMDGESKTYTYEYVVDSKDQTASGTVTASFENGNPDTKDNTQYTPDDIAISVTGVAPVASLECTQEEIGYVLVGNTTSASGTVTIENLGNGNLSGLGEESNLLGSVSISEGGDDFTGTGGTVSLEDDASQTFSFTYAPTMRQTTGSVTVLASFDNGNPDDGANGTYDKSFTFTGTAVAPVLELDTSKKNVELVRIGTSGTASISVTNVGDGNQSGLGDVSNLTGAMTAGTGTFVGDVGVCNLGDGLSETYSYVFTPTDHGESSEIINLVFTNGNPDGTNTEYFEDVTLSGTGIGPDFAAYDADDIEQEDDSTLDFSDLGTNGSMTLTLSNISEDENGGDTTLTDLTIFGYEITGEFKDLFTLTGLDAKTILDQGEELDLQITYAGTFDAEYTADLIFTTDQGAAYGETGETFTYQLYAGTGSTTVFSRMALNTSAVPEPGTWALLAAAGLFALGLARRCRRGGNG